MLHQYTVDEVLRQLLHGIGGLSVDETAHVLGVSPRTVGLDWNMARAWLRRELDGADPE